MDSLPDEIIAEILNKYFLQFSIKVSTNLNIAAVSSRFLNIICNNLNTLYAHSLPSIETYHEKNKYLKLHGIKTLNIDYDVITSNGGIIDVNSLLYLFECNPFIELLDASDNDISDLPKYISFVTSLIPNLTSLILSHVKLQSKAIKCFSKNLRHISNLRELDLSNNSIKSNEMKDLLDNFKYITKLCKLNISDNYCDFEILKNPFDVLKYIPDLQILNITYNRFGIKSMENLFSNLTYIPNLQELYIGDSRFSNTEATVFTDLTNIFKPRILAPNKDGIRSKDTNYLFDAFRRIPKLRTLEITHSNLQNEGIMYLADSLIHITNLRQLSIACDNIGQFGIEYFYKALKNIPYIKILKLQYNCFDFESIECLCSIADYIPRLQTLEITYDELSKRAAADAIKLQNTYKNVKIIYSSWF